MGLLSIFKRKADARPGAVAAKPTPEGVQQARARARQRLVGAVVLVVIGVIAFPLVFESQPRPVSVDIPIEIPRKEGAPPLVMPAARPTMQVPEPVAPPAKAVSEDVKPQVSGGPAPAAVTPPAASAAASAPAPAVAPRPAVTEPPPPEPSKRASTPASAPVTAAVPPPPAVPPPAAAPAPAAADAAKAKALLEGKPVAPKAAALKEAAPKEAAPKEAASKDAARYVVQVGAFAEASAVQDTRAKLEKLGLKSFTQVAETSAGNRTRVRIGPFASREEAERALAKAKAGGVSGVVLTL